MLIIIAILAVTSVLSGYVIIEKRISLRPCQKCGSPVSIDGRDEDCPRCGLLIPGGKTEST